MRRRKFITLLGGAAAWPFAAMAQQAGRTYRLGCLLYTPRDKPIVAAFFDELRRHGFTEGNTTGVSILVDEADGKRQDILIEAVPGLRLMAVLVDVNHTKNPAKLDALQEAARARNVEFSIHRVAKEGEIAAAIDSAQASGATALNILSSALFHAHRHLIMERAAAAHLPTIYELSETAEEGGFAAYGPRRSQLTEIMAQQIVKIFRGSKVADIPVEQATKFELVINLKTANGMGVTVPATLLARADKVIE
jgi:putative ABC transport system substrate-binding protein